MIRVMIVDDHTLVRQGIRQILEETEDIDVLVEARNGVEALEKVRLAEVDVVLLDISMPQMDGLSTIGVLKQERPDMAVLILTMHPEEQYAIRLLRAQAAGYLTKDALSDELISAIRRVAQGGHYITASLAERLAINVASRNHVRAHEMLSDREYQVMCLLASGQTITEIARSLSLSVKTISTYRTRILEKLGCHSNAEIVRYAIEHGLA